MAHLSLFLLTAFLLLLSVRGQRPGSRPGQCPKMDPYCSWMVKLTTGNLQGNASTYGVGMDIHMEPGDFHFPIFNLRDHGIGPYGPSGYYFRRNMASTFKFNGPCYPDFCKLSFHNLDRADWYLESASVKYSARKGEAGYGKKPEWSTMTVRRWLSLTKSSKSLSVTLDFCTHSVIENTQEQSTINK